MNKKGIEFGFSWIFAIIAGAVILFSAIYITAKLIGGEQTVSDTFVASELTNLLNPIETNLEDSKYTKIEFADETRVYNECSNSGVFGKQQVSTSSQLIGEKWGDKSVRRTSFNKYIFSRSVEETKDKELHALVKPFDMPFKIGDITLLYRGDYCFVNPTSDIEDEITDLGDIGINISQSISDCPRDSTTVCFGGVGCDVNVNFAAQIVSKDGVDLYYEGEALELAAIMSDPAIYECQIKRLMGRAGELGSIYARKAIYVEGSGCSNNLAADLQNFAVSTAINDSEDFVRSVVLLADDLEERNENLGKCKIF